MGGKGPSSDYPHLGPVLWACGPFRVHPYTYRGGPPRISSGDGGPAEPVHAVTIVLGPGDETYAGQVPTAHVDRAGLAAAVRERLSVLAWHVEYYRLILEDARTAEGRRALLQRLDEDAGTPSADEVITTWREGLDEAVAIHAAVLAALEALEAEQ